MTSAHIAALAIALCAFPALTQEHTEGTLTVVVMDQSGAVVPGARISATALETRAHFEATADANGQAVVHLDQGNYELMVQARGFQTWEEKNIEVNAELQRTVTLLVGQVVCGPCVVVDPVIPEIPSEHPQRAEEIPLVPVPQFVLSARPLRHRWRWF
jgi:hypothetical protein